MPTTMGSGWLRVSPWIDCGGGFSCLSDGNLIMTEVCKILLFSRGRKMEILARDMEFSSGSEF